MMKALMSDDYDGPLTLRDIPRPSPRSIRGPGEDRGKRAANSSWSIRTCSP